MRPTLLRYLLVEQIVPFFVSLFVLTLVLFLGRILRYTQLLFATGSGLLDLGKLFLYSLPYLFAFTIPMATLIAVLVAFSRLSHDNEITAMKTAGISLYQMIPPVAIMTGCAWLITSVITVFVLPPSAIVLERVLLEMAQTRVQFGLKERVFNNQFDGLVFFINSISPDGRRLKEVFISDERSPEMSKTIVAEEGLLLPQPDENRIDLRLFRGNIVRVDEEKRSTQTIKFQSYDFDLDLKSLASGRRTFRKDKQHMSILELRHALKVVKLHSELYYVLLIEYHWRLSLPFACLALGFLAAPVSLQRGSASRLTGVVTGLILFLLYYILTSAATALGQDGTLSPAIGLWLPSVIFGTLTIVMWIKTARESPIKTVTSFRRIGRSLLSKVRGRRRCDLP